MVPVYFLRLMADGRKLRTKVLFSTVELVAEAQDSEPPLIAADYPAWMAHPFAGSADRSGDDVRFRQGKIEFPGSDGLAS